MGVTVKVTSRGGSVSVVTLHVTSSDGFIEEHFRFMVSKRNDVSTQRKCPRLLTKYTTFTPCNNRSGVSDYTRIVGLVHTTTDGRPCGLEDRYHKYVFSCIYRTHFYHEHSNSRLLRKLVPSYKVVQIWPGQTVTCLHTNSPCHI